MAAIKYSFDLMLGTEEAVIKFVEGLQPGGFGMSTTGTTIPMLMVTTILPMTMVVWSE